MNYLFIHTKISLRLCIFVEDFWLEHMHMFQGIYQPLADVWPTPQIYINIGILVRGYGA